MNIFRRISLRLSDGPKPSGPPPGVGRRRRVGDDDDGVIHGVRCRGPGGLAGDGGGHTVDRPGGLLPEVVLFVHGATLGPRPVLRDASRGLEGPVARRTFLVVHWDLRGSRGRHGDGPRRLLLPGHLISEVGYEVPGTVPQRRSEPARGPLIHLCAQLGLVGGFSAEIEHLVLGRLDPASSLPCVEVDFFSPLLGNLFDHLDAKWT